MIANPVSGMSGGSSSGSGGVKGVLSKLGQGAQKIGSAVSNAAKDSPTPAPQADTKAASYLPKRHKGGPVMKSGPYLLQAGEHVLTAKEAKMARKHAMVASGMKSLAKEAPAAKAVKAVKENKKTGGLSTTVNPDDMA